MCPFNSRSSVSLPRLLTPSPPTHTHRMLHVDRRILQNAVRNVLDGELLNRYLYLSTMERGELAKKIGTTPDIVSAWLLPCPACLSTPPATPLINSPPLSPRSWTTSWRQTVSQPTSSPFLFFVQNTNESDWFGKSVWSLQTVAICLHHALTQAPKPWVLGLPHLRPWPSHLVPGLRSQACCAVLYPASDPRTQGTWTALRPRRGSPTATGSEPHGR